MAERLALRADAVELLARIHDIRAAFGNPFFYSTPDHSDESEANYTGYRSHAVFLPTFTELRSVIAEIVRIEAELAADADENPPITES